MLSTTLTTNAVVQNQLDPVGLVVMNGPGVSPKDLPLYDKANYIAGYMSHRGIEAEAPDRSELAELKEKFKKDKINRFAIVGKSRPEIRFMNRKWMLGWTISPNMLPRAISFPGP